MGSGAFAGQQRASTTITMVSRGQALHVRYTGSYEVMEIVNAIGMHSRRAVVQLAERDAIIADGQRALRVTYLGNT